MIVAQLPNGRYIYVARNGFAVQPLRDNWWKAFPSVQSAAFWFLRQWLREYGGRILKNQMLEMRDPNDNCQRRFQYQWQNGIAMRRVLPWRGDWKDYPAQWEEFEWRAGDNIFSGPIHAFFLLIEQR